MNVLLKLGRCDLAQQRIIFVPLLAVALCPAGGWDPAEGRERPGFVTMCSDAGHV